jgi:hypothetical protein
MTKIDDTITSLVGDLQPVRSLRSPFARGMGLASSLLVIMLLVWWGIFPPSIRHGMALREHLVYVFRSSMLIAVGTFLLIVSFRYSIPRPPSRVLSPFFRVVAFILFAAIYSLPFLSMHEAWVPGLKRPHCVLEVIGGVCGGSILLAFVLSRGYCLRGVPCAFAAAGGVTLLSVGLMDLCCVSSCHHSMWLHLMPSIGVGVGTIFPFLLIVKKSGTTF